MALVAVIRIKGHVGIKPEIKKTLESLKLDKAFKAALFNESDTLNGMLKKAQRYLTWGRPNKHTILTLLKKAGVGGEDVETFAEKLEKGEEKLSQPVYVSLHPPSQGFKNTVKRSYKYKGEYGDRGEAINELIRRMV
ncbi:large subunit ribosomal protein L30 [Candidatus Caldarchaeum subterraneum]|uniref:Large subunit ribosomal protein L30 n=1 Tax=Caldiarchaeum subterraneum TaxID=311458 RepID=E6N5F5_CALS0|nr:large subunit ribosomal protein L30 [Candidatus Caldarchaeum subterraneum]BAJ49325.1 large subunit ribosomal protein L30 [Candidatus Caldarchaeum subterraneum]BAJ50340.1 large subunit ribosomal protein L30 [Candidatus Caldarchaeum subterraneum]